MILLARELLDGVPGRLHPARIDLVRRNGYGPQRCSFEADVDLVAERRPFRGVFIRAPQIAAASPEVEVLGALGGEPVLLRQGTVLVAAFPRARRRHASMSASYRPSRAAGRC